MEKTSIDIVPGESIGPLRVGTRVADLPKRATVSEPGGELDGVKFFAADGVIDDVWIDDLRKFTAEVRFDGKIVPHDHSLSALKKMFGPCEEVAGRKGGLFFNCATGIAIGTDFRGAGIFIQIRLKKL